jgi:hypothetical protein
MPIELSLHRMRGREPQPLDERRYLDDHQFARVEDEEMLSFETPDGGRAEVVGAGPAGWGGHGGATGVEFSIDVLSEQLVQILHSHAVHGGMVLARWPPLPASRGYVFAWDPRLETTLRECEAMGVELQVRSTPVAVFATTADQARHLPAGWPTPVVCTTAEQLLEPLSSG